TFKPYFYPSNKLILDAKGMIIKSIVLDKDSVQVPLSYEYDKEYLSIQLDKTYSRFEQFSIAIEYTAQPNSLERDGSAAITDARGLYFINPDSTEVNKPTQLWTQGEPESNSCWFPTIDSPNERMTQEIFIRLKEEYKSLSNGTLVYSNYHDDGTRTDYWKMDQAHPPYLAMIAAGDFAKAIQSYTKKNGEEIPVEYLVEKEYANHVFSIFGNTPEMIAFYSDLLGYDYPWDKYSQIVVRDYVSGAMENTTAVIHGEFLQQTTRELIDSDNEEIIAHELFHHWFGDLVTCESWGHLPLNESFATYGEYLWEQHKYGQDAADYHQWQSTDGYLYEAEYKQVPLIRYDYEMPDDMFDAHSYNKGGHVLHMLRSILGDDAFFEALNHYLNNNAFKHAEVDQLRLSFEQISGLDLKWFFDQWFFTAGHPDVNISYFISDDEIQVQITQLQTYLDQPAFQLPIQIDLHFTDGLETHEVILKESEQVFSFPLSRSLEWVNVDAKKVLLWEKQDERPEDWWIKQMKFSGPLLNRIEALEHVLENPTQINQEWIELAAEDTFGYINLLGVMLIEEAPKAIDVLPSLLRIIENTESTETESYAIEVLADFGPQQELERIVEERLLNEQSYYVLSSCLLALSNYNPTRALELSQEYKDLSNVDMNLAVADILLIANSEEGIKYIMEKMSSSSSFEEYEFASIYANWMFEQALIIQVQHLDDFEEIAKSGKAWWTRYLGYAVLAEARNQLNDSAEEADRERASELTETLNALIDEESNQELLNLLQQ
ncbi:MAG: M1 family metallopeptidase, partial [Flavobacteriales bacterium]